MKSLAACLFAAALLGSCTSYQIPALDVSLAVRHGELNGGKVDISPMLPYLKRATWSDSRQPFTVWKVWDDIELANGTRLQLNLGCRSFRIAGVQGEYYVREEDVAKCKSAHERIRR